MVGRKMVRRKDGQIEDGWMARWKIGRKIVG